MHTRRNFSQGLHLLVFVSIILMTTAFTPPTNDNLMATVKPGNKRDVFPAHNTQSPDFTIELHPSELFICTPSEANYTVNIGQIEGFSDTVTLFTSIQPSGTTASFNTNPIVPPGDSLLTIGNTGTVTAGAYQIEVTGLAPTSTHTADADLIVYTSSPTTPVPLTPANTESDVTLTPTFTWSLANQGKTYNLEIALDSNFNNIVIDKTLSVTTFTAETELDSNTTYFWRVSSMNSCGTSGFSNVFRFTTQPASSNTIFLPLILR